VPGPGETLGGLRGAGTELRNQMRTRRRLRVVTLVSLAAIVLIVLPVIFGLRSAGRDPVFSSLDSLKVPSWAQTKVEDRSSGSRWCFIDCRFRERVADSSKPFKETTQAYDDALTSAGWQLWKVSDCPEQPLAAGSGTYSCWKRDEFTLDLRVSLPDCAVDALAAQDPAALPSSAVAPPTTDPSKCVGSTVSLHVQNAITDTRGKKEPKQSPDLIGETPDPTFSDDPLLGTPTPTPS
jgi:integrin beta 3